MSRDHAYLGWVPDLPDGRDFEFSPRLFGAHKPAVFPSSVDLRPQCGEVYDQGEIGSCTANAIASALVFDQIKQGLEPDTPSRLFIYYNERAVEGTTAVDCGAMLRDGIKSVAELGVPSERLWPYYIKAFAQKPAVLAYNEALKHQALRYAAIEQSERGVMECLASGFPFVFGFSTYASFSDDYSLSSGIMPPPQKGEEMTGGHAVKAVGYENIGGELWVWIKNSWGSDWGIKGYFRMPMAYLLDENNAADFWAIQLIEA